MVQKVKNKREKRKEKRTIGNGLRSRKIFPLSPLTFNLTKGVKLVAVLTIVTLTGVMFSISPAKAAISNQINFQGKIVNKVPGTNLVSGTPACVKVGADTCDFQVRVWNSSSGVSVTSGTGNLMYTQTFQDVEIGDYNGIFNLSINSCDSQALSNSDWGTNVGTCTVVDDSDVDTEAGVDFNRQDLWMEVGFAPTDTTGSLGSFSELFSRKQLTSVPSAFEAQRLGGKSADGFVQVSPSAAQTTGNTTNAIVWLNEDGTGTPDLLNLQVGGASQFVVQNDGTTIVDGNLNPNQDDTFTLGTDTARWKDLYLGPSSLRIGTSGNDSIISYNTTLNRIEIDADADTIAEMYLTDSGDLKIEGTLESGNFASDPVACDSTKSGEIYYNTVTNTYRYCNGTLWIDFSAGGTGSAGIYTASGTVPDGSFLELSHNQGTTNVVASGWKTYSSVGTKEAISARTGIVANWGDGTDGSVVTAGTFNLNSSTSGGRSFADGIAYRIDPASITGSTLSQYDANSDFLNGLEIGDEVIVINLQGVAGDTADVGNYEFLKIQSLTSTSITFTTPISNSYDGATAVNQKVVVQRIPQYTNFTISNGDSLTSGNWDQLTTLPTGTAGYNTGIIIFRVSGNLTIGTGSSISASQLGYIGANLTSDAESIDGLAARGGAFGANGGGGEHSVPSGGVSPITGGAGGGPGGGKGSDSPSPSCAGGGGGGGGRGTARVVPGNNSSSTKLYLGSGATQGSRGGNSGGTAGGSNCTGGFGATGGAGGAAKHNVGVVGDGGGIVYFSAANVTNAGTIVAVGGNGNGGGAGGTSAVGCCLYKVGGGGGGGGQGGGGAAGGSLVIDSYSTVIASASGGAGGAGGAGGGAIDGSTAGSGGPNGTNGPAGYSNITQIAEETSNDLYSIVVYDPNKVRLYNYTGSSQTLELNVAVNLSGADYAENFLTYQKDLKIGELVAVDEKNDLSVVRASRSNESKYFGIISTSPGSLIGGKSGETGETITPATLYAKENNKEIIDSGKAKVVPVALEGKVPVKVSEENGQIQKGDKLTVSDTPGYAAKHNGNGVVVGIAMEDFDPNNNENDFIIVLLSKESNNTQSIYVSGDLRLLIPLLIISAITYKIVLKIKSKDKTQLKFTKFSLRNKDY